MLGAAVMGALGGTPRTIEWGWFQISIANLVVVLLMVVVFAAALLVPFPKGKGKQ